jgi:hypothetical protein
LLSQFLVAGLQVPPAAATGWNLQKVYTLCIEKRDAGVANEYPLHPAMVCLRTEMPLSSGGWSA